jgi:hypothetical protein
MAAISCRTVIIIIIIFIRIHGHFLIHMGTDQLSEADLDGVYAVV